MSIPTNTNPKLTPVQVRTVRNLPMPIEEWRKLDIKTRRSLVSKDVVVNAGNGWIHLNPNWRGKDY